jgi:phosphoribosyl-ATP pyrophosphohydrolase/phosphoribosyl-AMP cyclohydrolase
MSQLPLNFDQDGLIPVVVQDHLTGEVRMVAFATREAIKTTLQTGRATFWSRSRGELWEKGRTSGNTIAVKRVLVDCDADCVVYSAEPRGPSCHTGAQSCFFHTLEAGESALRQRSEEPQTIFATLEAVLESRKKSAGQSSYTKALYDGGAQAIGGKLREEADELSRALEKESDDRVANEAADLLYHMLVGLRWRAIPLRDVLGVLAARMGTSGHEEKANRG